MQDPTLKAHQSPNQEPLPTVWIVTYWTDDSFDEPVVTPFCNKEAAIVAFDYFRQTRKYVCIDKCDVFKHFETSKD